MKHPNGTGRQRTLRGMELLEPRQMLAAQPIVSEFMASNSSTIEDGFGQDSDWIELANIGDAPVDLAGYYLSDSIDNPMKWSFPTSTILNPGQYLIVFASDANTVDPLGYHHTNLKLSADGEHVVLATPDGTILSQLGPDGNDYPPQLPNISYGVAGPAVVTGDTPAQYLIPTKGTLGTSWTQVDFDAAANGFVAGTASVGYDTTPSPINYANYFNTPLPVGTTSVYVRIEFDLPNAAAVTSLDLILKYDDGVVVYLNGTKVVRDRAPATPLWNSLATGDRPDSTVIAGTNFPLSSYIDLLQTGKNVLAIQLLNLGSGSSDFLVEPLLRVLPGSTAVGYLATPTPGAANSTIMQIGPLIDSVVTTPTQPRAGETITVTANVASFLAPIDTGSVRLHYRVMYGSEINTPMYDDGFTAGDLVAGDGIYTAQIPGNASVAGQMVRWYVTAEDINGVASRAPRYLDPLDSPQYYGTVVIDSSVTTDLPVIHWFVQNPGAAATEAGTRSSLYVFGEFYDNVQVDLHGQSTTQPEFLKKSYNFDANNGLKFEFPGLLGRASDFNLLTNFTDKTYYRNTMAYALYTEAGGPGLKAFSAVVQMNGSYYGLYDVVEEAQSEFLERVGLDPDGALYKMGNGFDSATHLVEKKTRKYEGHDDLQQLVNSAALNSSPGEAWVKDNLDIASWVNYFAVQSLIANRDYGQKNYYLYNDSNDTQLWSLLPWDMDLSFGHQWNFAENYFDDDLIWNDGLYVYMGGNHLIQRLIATPQFTSMYTRRLRTLTDEFFGPPGQHISESVVVQKINDLMAEIGADALIDRNKWGTAAGMAFETPAQAVARVQADFLARRKAHLNGLSSIPAPQVAMPDIAFGTIDHNPVSGNDQQQFIALVNQSSSAVDISGWTVTGSASHTFRGGTVIPAHSTYYLVADVSEFKLRTTGPQGGQKLWIQGNFEGKLNPLFGQLTLKTTGGTTIATTEYGTQPLPGDYDRDDDVDGRDFLVWQRTFGSPATPAGSGADGDASGTIDAGDLGMWQNNYGATAHASVTSPTAAIESQNEHGIADEMILPAAAYAQWHAGRVWSIVKPDQTTALYFVPEVKSSSTEHNFVPLKSPGIGSCPSMSPALSVPVMKPGDNQFSKPAIRDSVPEMTRAIDAALESLLT